MAMLEIKDIHKTFYTYDDKPRFHIGNLSEIPALAASIQ